MQTAKLIPSIILSLVFLPVASADTPCMTNDDCPSTQYCAHPTGDCNAEGTCIDRLDELVQCLDVWLPVCGCDGVTYSNGCYAHRAAASIDHAGECTNNGLPCTTNNDCPADQYCAHPVGACDAEGACIDRLDELTQCLAVWQPVCGCNGLTYSNACYAHQAAVSIDYPGECVDTSEIDAHASGVHYRLLEGSTITDLLDLSPTPAVRPLHGGFVLKRIPADALWPTYLVNNIRFDTDNTEPSYSIRGSGWYRLYDHEPSGLHELFLDVAINANAPIHHLASDTEPRQARFPTIEIDVTEYPNSSNEHQYAIHVIAEPIREYWFSTEVGFTSGAASTFTPISDGDILSTTGRIVRTNFQLAGQLGIMPPTPDVGLDALARTPATESILYSSETDQFSEWIGPIQHGDLLNEHGFITATNQQLTSAFIPMPPAPDAGLDAAHVSLTTGEILFSLEDPLFSEALGENLDPGDVLSDAGYVAKTNAQLLWRFDPQTPDPAGYGLDALTQVSNGATQFSIDEGFYDTRFNWISDGDLLSDNGHVIARNLQLVWPFAPLEDVDNFGLDALQAGPVMPAADHNTDGAVDLQDFCEFQTAVTGPNIEPPTNNMWADLDGDNDVDRDDYTLFHQDLTGP